MVGEGSTAGSCLASLSRASDQVPTICYTCIECRAGERNRAIPNGLGIFGDRASWIDLFGYTAVERGALYPPVRRVHPQVTLTFNIETFVILVGSQLLGRAIQTLTRSFAVDQALPGHTPVHVTKWRGEGGPRG